MKIFYLRENVVGIGEAHRDVDTGFIRPPNGHRLCSLYLGVTQVPSCCAVKDGDSRYTYFCKDGAEAIDLTKVEFDDLGAKLAGWPVDKANNEKNKANENIESLLRQADEEINYGKRRLDNEPEYTAQWKAYIKSAENGKAQLEGYLKTLSIGQLLEFHRKDHVISPDIIRRNAMDAFSVASFARRGGSAKTERKATTAAENGKKGGRPKKLLTVNDDNVLIDGHARLEAAKKIGVKKIPVERKEKTNG